MGEEQRKWGYLAPHHVTLLIYLQRYVSKRLQADEEEVRCLRNTAKPLPASRCRLCCAHKHFLCAKLWLLWTLFTSWYAFHCICRVLVSDSLESRLRGT